MCSLIDDGAAHRKCRWLSAVAASSPSGTAYLLQRARGEDRACGFVEGSAQSNAVWGGGETPAIKGIVNPATIVLAGSAIGRLKPKIRRITGNVQDGDAMILLAPIRVQTNGLTLCRALADPLPQAYLTSIGDGRTYGEALLGPRAIYVKFIAACHDAGIALHYAAQITGHGWRKLMRLEEPFVYRLTDIRPPTPIFRFIMETGQSTAANPTTPSTWARASPFTSPHRRRPRHPT